MFLELLPHTSPSYVLGLGRGLYKFLIIRASSSEAAWLRDSLKAGALLSLRAQGGFGGQTAPSVIYLPCFQSSLAVPSG